jgi:hypothetical protein
MKVSIAIYEDLKSIVVDYGMGNERILTVKYNSEEDKEVLFKKVFEFITFYLSYKKSN